jgi:hypothetical protein
MELSGWAEDCHSLEKQCLSPASGFLMVQLASSEEIWGQDLSGCYSEHLRLHAIPLLSPNPQCSGIKMSSLGRWLDPEGSTFMSRISALIKRSEDLVHFFCCLKTEWEGATCEPESAPSLNTELVMALILGFPDFWTVSNTFLLLIIYPV